MAIPTIKFSSEDGSQQKHSDDSIILDLTSDGDLQLAFMHEMGHRACGHRRYTWTPFEEYLKFELEAWAWALLRWQKDYNTAFKEACECLQTYVDFGLPGQQAEEVLYQHLEDSL